MPTYPMGDQHLGPLVYYKDRGDQATSLMDMVHGYHEIPTATSLSSFDVTKINLRYECGYKSSTRTCHDVDEAMCQQE
uniref:Reverse transcriptase n=1 Tax=Romanomermis culicivorax TaxID=13658 RepID=A0A915I7F8_ROMCU